MTDQLLKTISRAFGIEGLDAPENREVARWALWLSLVAMIIRAVFWAYTQRYWEDAYITCLHSENFVLGLGMTHYRPGEPPLHGFTSPLSVLVPLIGDFIHVGFGVDFIKLFSIPCAALTVLYVCGICIHPKFRVSAPLAVLVMGFVAVEHHQILWGMAGMETQMVVLTLMASLYHAMAWHPKRLGVWLGLCMLARPDYCFWCAIVGVYGLFRDWRRMPQVVGLALAVYLPWIAFTIWEYGSPVPNTIIAKGTGYKKWYEWEGHVDYFVVKRHMWRMMSEQLHVMLGPTFGGHGAGLHRFYTSGNESPIGNLMFWFATFGTVIIGLTRRYALWPLVAGTVAYSLYYIFLVPVAFGWYKVPFLVMLLLLSVWGIHAASRVIPGDNFRRGFLWAFTACYLGAFISVLPWTFYAEHQIQKYIENGVRREAGLYLHEHMKPGEAVGCEPLGYISYFSRNEVYDWPGLASRRVTQWSQHHAGERNLETMLKDLQPEWLFLRDLEMNFYFKDRQFFRDHYHPVKLFRVDPEDVKKIPWADRNIDMDFRIYKKNHDGDAPYDDSLWSFDREPLGGDWLER